MSVFDKSWQTLTIESASHGATITLSRVARRNAMSLEMFDELAQALDQCDRQNEIPVILIQAAGPHFSAGIDFDSLMTVVGGLMAQPEGAKQDQLRQHIEQLQWQTAAPVRCRKPVIAAIHGYCIGAALEWVAGCDIRLASMDSQFALKEVDLGIVADLGGLQRLPSLVGEGRLRHWAMTGDFVSAEQALHAGLITQLANSLDDLHHQAHALAGQLAHKPPLTLQGIKQTLNQAGDSAIRQGLYQVALRNSAMLLSEETFAAVQNAVAQRSPSPSSVD